jgi:TRAP-type C4-dicarboxylate transport system substrate-binding protein
MIQRRTLLKSGAAIALGAPAITGFAQQSVTLKFHTFMAPQSHVYLNMHKAWMDKVSRDSDGLIKFEGFPAMQMGGTPPQLYDQARDGVADIIWTLPGYTAGRFPRAEVFELPFMMNNADATSRAYWEYIHTMAPDEFKDVHVLALHVHGPGVFHMRDKLVRTADDLAGVKMRGPTRQATKLLGYLGATPVGMPLPQIPDALSKGVINGCTIPWEVVPSVKVHELAQYHSEFAPEVGALYTSVFIMAMNKAKYASLPPHIKAVIDKNSGIETSAWLGRVQQEGDIPGREVTVKRGNTIHVIDGADAQSFKRKGHLVEAEWVQDMDKRGYDGKKLLDTAKALIEKYGKST